MILDDRLIDLLSQWEEIAGQGEQPDVALLARGDEQLAAQLQRYAGVLRRFEWLDRELPPSADLPLPSAQTLRSVLLMPEGLDLATLQANLAKADLVDAETIAELQKTRHVTTAPQLAGLLLESETLTRFQLRAIAQGKTRGLRLGRYVILDKIGAGGMGQVFKARHSKMDRVVAIKVLPRESMSNETSTKRFYQEVQVAASLRHPNIVTAFDANEEEGLHYLVMEYVEGRDLDSLVRRQGPLSTAQAVDCLLQAARGLQYAHSVGLVHRDIKPANLLLDSKGHLKILDMGIARIQSDSDTTSLTLNGAIMGTVDYMAPEQAVDAKTVTSQADLYSLGCSLCYLLTGRPPFAGETLMVKLLAHREHAPPSLSNQRPDVPGELNAIYQKCLAKSAADRYADAGELIADLEKIRPSLSETAPQGLADFPSQASSSSINLSAASTQSNPIATPVVTLKVDPERRKKTQPQRGASFFGGAIAVGLLLCGFCYYGAAALFKISTPDGTLVVEIDDEDYVAHLRGQEVKLVNEKTKQSTTIKLLSPEEKKKLAPGVYKFALETSEGLRTSVDQFTISSGTEASVKVYWEKPPVLAQVAASAKAVQSPGTKLVASPHDYDSLATGTWISLVTSAEDLDRVLAARTKPVGPQEFVAYNDGVIQLRDTSLYFPFVTAKNFLLRGRLKFDSGLNVVLKARSPTPSYGAWWNLGGDQFGIGTTKSGSWHDLVVGNTKEKPPEFAEMALLGVDRTLILYVDGKEVLRTEREEEPTDQLSVGVGAKGAGKAKDLQLMILPDDLAVPPLQHADDPDYVAAKRLLSVGGAVRVNGNWIYSVNQLPNPPISVEAISIVDCKNAHDSDLSLFAGSTNLEEAYFVNVSSESSLTGQCFEHVANCPNLRCFSCVQNPQLNAGIIHLAKCKKLETVDLWGSGVKLSELLPLANGKFKKFRLSSNHVTDDWMPQLPFVRETEELGLAYSGIGNPALAQLRSSQSLRSLALERTFVTDDGLEQLRDCPNLEELNLFLTSISDASVGLLSSFPNLIRVNVKGTKISPAGVEKLRQALPNCEITWSGGTIKPGSKTPVASEAPTANGYDRFAKGEWKSLIANQKDFERLLEYREMPIPADQSATFHNGILTIQKTTLYTPPIKGKNYLFRGKLKYDYGTHIVLKVRYPSGAYVAWWNGGGTSFGLAEHIAGGGFVEHKQATLPQSPPEKCELAIAGIGQDLIVYVEGKELLRWKTETPIGEEISVGVATSSNSQGQYSDLQLMVLPDDLVAPPLPLHDDPD
ncbi:serine/threonine-protein kinase [Blastopirellula marina]|nr:serine/threonine-protein kinase [Blastopirellula marina]